MLAPLFDNTDRKIAFSLNVDIANTTAQLFTDADFVKMMPRPYNNVLFSCLFHSLQTRFGSDAVLLFAKWKEEEEKYIQLFYVGVSQWTEVSTKTTRGRTQFQNQSAIKSDWALLVKVNTQSLPLYTLDHVKIWLIIFFGDLLIFFLSPPLDQTTHEMSESNRQTAIEVIDKYFRGFAFWTLH